MAVVLARQPRAGRAHEGGAVTASGVRASDFATSHSGPSPHTVAVAAAQP